MEQTNTTLTKPRLRGYFHLLALIVSVIACVLMLSRTNSRTTFISLLIYSLSLTGLFAISSLYHIPMWKPEARKWLRRLDHSAIYTMIAGTGTPIFYLALPLETGVTLLMLTWSVALFGIIQSLFWVNAPKWVSAILYLLAGYLVIPYIKELNAGLGRESITMIFIGGFFYTAGALTYAFKKPDPWPKTFGYHEIFHILVIAGAVFHFIVINRLIRF